MLKKIAIRNFKSLKNTVIETKNLNILVGLNGAGKSSFVQVLLLLKQNVNELITTGCLPLNGELVVIGKIEDALYEFAEKEEIEFILRESASSNKELEFKCKFKCNNLSYDKLNNNQIAPNQDSAKSSTFLSSKTFQFLSADRIGPQSMYDVSLSNIEEKRLGVRGEYTVCFLNTYGDKYEVNKVLRHKTIKNESALLSHVNAWMGEISPNVKLDISELPRIEKLLLTYRFALSRTATRNFRPSNVGYGISYVLPIIVSLLTAEKDKIVIIENPESHIHPKGQAELGKLLALSASVGTQIFVETHSDHIINGVRVAVKNNFINKNDVNISFFDRVTRKNENNEEQYTEVTNIRIDPNGELSEYPKNFLDEWNNQLLELV